LQRIYVIEDLCNGCRLCESFCASLEMGVFGDHGLIKVIKLPGEERDIPVIDCSGMCVRPIYDDGMPTCVSLCPTGALIFAEHAEAIDKRLAWENARQTHGLFKVIAPWKWPFPWRAAGPPAEPFGEGWSS
jgi:Fe-S-cluster-containing dehydrogenase component